MCLFCSLVDDQNEVDSRGTPASNRALTPSGNQSVRVFVVLYDYDPDQSSPNDQPDLELTLRTGDYVFVFGDMDEASTALCYFHSLCLTTNV